MLTTIALAALIFAAYVLNAIRRDVEQRAHNEYLLQLYLEADRRAFANSLEASVLCAYIESRNQAYLESQKH